MRDLVELDAGPGKTGVAGASQESIELDELAAFPFPTHPAALAGIPHAAAMKEKEAVRLVGAVASVQELDALQGGLQVILVLGHCRGRGVRKIGQESKSNLRVRVREVMDFQSL